MSVHVFMKQFSLPRFVCNEIIRAVEYVQHEFTADFCASRRNDAHFTRL